SKTPEDRFPTCTDLVGTLLQAGQGTPVGATVNALDLTETPAVVRVSPTARTTQAARPAAAPVQEISGDGSLFPALVICLGCLARQCLDHLLTVWLERCGPAEAIPHILFLALDSETEYDRPPVQPAVLTDDEVLVAPLNRPSHYLKPVRNRAALDTWLNLSM